MDYKENELLTPCYIINEMKLKQTIEEFKDAIKKEYPKTILSYSYKTNYYSFVIRFMKENEIWAEVTSENEYNLATKFLGYHNQIIYNGPIKTKETFIEALNNGCIVNLDSKREIEWLKELNPNKNYKIGLRIQFDMKKYCPNESFFKDEVSRFGFCMENGELTNVINKIFEISNVEIKYLHLHNAVNTRSLKIYECIAERACEVIIKYNLNIEYINVGGGFKLGVFDELNMDSYLKIIKDVIREKYKFRDIKLIIEPGNSMIYRSIDYKMSVIDIKENLKQSLVVLDGSRIHTDPSFKGTGYSIDIEYKSLENKKLEKQQLVGCTCRENDRFLNIIDSVKLNVGDFITLKNIGSYTMSLVPNFIITFPNVYIKKQNTYYNIYAKKKDYMIMIQEEKNEKNFINN